MSAARHGRTLEAGLAGHLRAAIRQNLARRPGYRRRGGPRAWALSVALVAHERALLPVAGLLDRQARPFEAAGLTPLAGLQPISASPPPGRVLEGVGAISRLDLVAVGRAVRDAAGAVLGAVRQGDLAAAAAALARALDAVEACEAGGVRLALTAHVIESAGLSALGGLEPAARTAGRTLGLSRRFVAGQLGLLPGALALDALAGPVHARGVPLFVDDVPPVPFRAALAAGAREP